MLSFEISLEEATLHTRRILMSVILATGAVTAAANAFAAETINIKPGLWEVTKTLTTSGDPLWVEGMPPAGRAEYAKSWAKGVNKPETDKDQQCITAKDIKESKLLQDQTGAG